MGKDFMRFRFKTDDNLPYNWEINVKVCVKGWYYPQVELEDCFYESSNFF